MCLLFYILVTLCCWFGFLICCFLVVALVVDCIDVCCLGCIVLIELFVLIVIILDMNSRLYLLLTFCGCFVLIYCVNFVYARVCGCLY